MHFHRIVRTGSNQTNFREKVLPRESKCTRLVEDALKPLDKNRRAFRLVGGVLVERTVGEVLPSVSSNRANLEGVVDNMRKTLEEKQKEMFIWKNKYNIRTAEEAEAARKQQMASN